MAIRQVGSAPLWVGTSADWAAAGDPVLRAGHVGLDTDTGVWKLGNDAASWSSLGPIPLSLTHLVSGMLALSAKASPVDADILPLFDSAASGAPKKLTLADLKTVIVALIVSSAPATLDTLDELAAALGDDPNFATTMTNALAGKQPKATGTPDGSKFLRDDNSWAVPSGGSGTGFDTYANRPAANTVPGGYLYTCSDIDSTYRSNGSAWVQVDCGGGPIIGEPPTSGWTSVNIGTATVANDKGTLLLTCPAVGSTTDTLRAQSRTVSGTPTIVGKFDFHLTLANGPGLYFGFTDGTKFKLWAMQMQASQTLTLLRQNWNTTTSINTTTNICSGPPAVFLMQCKWWRIVDNGTNHLFQLSTNGLDWQTIDSISRTDFLTPTAFCFGMNTYGSGYTASARLRQFAIT